MFLDIGLILTKILHTSNGGIVISIKDGSVIGLGRLRSISTKMSKAGFQGPVETLTAV